MKAPFSRPQVLAQVTSKTYTEYKTGETEAQYAKRSVLPDGCNVLSIESNIIKGKCCLWTAHGHPEHQHFVTVHRAQSLKRLDHCGRFN